MAASWESTGTKSGERSLELRVPSRGPLGALRVLRVSRTFGLGPPALRLLCLMRGMFTPLLRVRSISCVTLELFDRSR